MKTVLKSILILTGGVMLSACGMGGKAHEKPVPAELQGMKVIGIDARTRNHDEVLGKGKIPALWKRFLTENIAAKIPNQTEPGKIVVVYTDIETDETGPYRIIIGAPVKNLEKIPAGMTGHSIPPAQYIKFTTVRGSLKTIGIRAWQAIWADKALKKRRAYKSDLEIYDGRSRDPANAQFDIFVGVK